MGILQPALTTLSSVIFSGPAHLLCFSALLGGQLYQTFVLTTIAFRALPRQPFTTLQAKLFPAYFRLQTAALLLTVLTWPPYSVLSLADAKSHWIPLAVAMGAAVQNLLLFGPRTGRAMIDLAQMGKLQRFLRAVAGELSSAKLTQRFVHCRPREEAR